MNDKLVLDFEYHKLDLMVDYEYLIRWYYLYGAVNQNLVQTLTHPLQLWSEKENKNTQKRFKKLNTPFPLSLFTPTPKWTQYKFYRKKYTRKYLKKP